MIVIIWQWYSYHPLHSRPCSVVVWFTQLSPFMQSDHLFSWSNHHLADLQRYKEKDSLSYEIELLYFKNENVRAWVLEF